MVTILIVRENIYNHKYLEIYLQAHHKILFWLKKIIYKTIIV